MESKTTQERKFERAGYADITTTRQSKDYYEQTTPTDESADWQFRISVLPTEENLHKAAQVLDKFFKNNKQTPSFWVKCLVLPSQDAEKSGNTIQDWDPKCLNGNDRDQRGREICVYMSTKSKATNEYIKTPEEWKALMLSLWKELQEAGVQLGYTPTTSGDRAVPTELGLLTPFSYTSFKPYNQRHRILNQTDHNPYKMDDPLHGITRMSWKDLEDYKINTDIVKKEGDMRLRYAENHIKDMEAEIVKKIDSISKMPSYNEEFAPINPKAQIVDKTAAETLTGQEAADEIENMKKDFQDTTIINFFKNHFDYKGYSDSQISAQINKHIDKAPSEMQKVYRGIMHLEHEKAAFTVEKNNCTKAKFQNLNRDPKQHLIKNLKDQIETIDFKVGFLGGQKIECNGKEKIVPHTVAAVWNELMQAKKETYEDSLNKIESILTERTSNKNISEFNNIYTSWKEQIENLELEKPTLRFSTS